MKRMKRILVFTMCVLLLASLSGCGSGNSTPEPTAPPTPEQRGEEPAGSAETPNDTPAQPVQQNNTAGTLSLLSSLLGAGMASQQAQPQVQQPQTINLFGGQTQQPAQNNTSAGASLLSSLLGGMGGLQQAQPVQQVQQQTVNLFGGQTQSAQPQQSSQGGGLMDLLMGLISTDTSGK